MSTLTTQLSVLQIIEEALQEITESMVARAASKLDPVDEKTERTLGALQDECTKRLHCVYHKFRGQALQSAARFVEKEAFVQEMEKWTELSQFAQHLFWVQARRDMSAWTSDLGLRSGWTVVEKQTGAL